MQYLGSSSLYARFDESTYLDSGWMPMRIGIALCYDCICVSLKIYLAIF